MLVSSTEKEEQEEKDWEKREEYMKKVTIGGPTPLAGPVQLEEYNPEWPQLFEQEAQRVKAALGDRVLLLEHVGSTSVPGLAAKPRIDMLLLVADSSDEAAYVPDMEAAGYILKIREPDWHEHRLFNSPDIPLNLHVFSPGSTEINRMLLFRNWLRNNEADRKLYETTKKELARQDWKYMQNYADAKTAVVEEIIGHAQKSSQS